MEFNPQDISLIIGIGNPKDAYQDTYHNAGLRAVMNLAQCTFATPRGKHFEYCKTGIYTYALSLTYMNTSGTAVQEFLSYFKELPKQLLIAHDDSDLELGTYKLSFGRGSAGHAGIESIITSLGTNKFWRLRIGIRPDGENRKAEEFVLSAISEKNEGLLNKTFDDIKNLFIQNTKNV